MERIGDILSIATLGWLSWQDFHTRRIVWWLLPLLAIARVLSAFGQTGVIAVGKNFLFNSGFLLLQFLLTWIWFSARLKKPATLVDRQIGSGDLLFLVCITPAFSPMNFIVFYSAAMIFSLLLALLLRRVKISTTEEIPLAGLLSLPLIGLCTWRLIDPHFNFCNEEWMIRLLE